MNSGSPPAINGVLETALHGDDLDRESRVHIKARRPALDAERRASDGESNPRRVASVVTIQSTARDRRK